MKLKDKTKYLENQRLVTVDWLEKLVKYADDLMSKEGYELTKMDVVLLTGHASVAKYFIESGQKPLDRESILENQRIKKNKND